MEGKTMTMNVLAYSAQSTKSDVKYRFVSYMASLRD
jgi:hypothetical protein